VREVSPHARSNWSNLSREDIPNTRALAAWSGVGKAFSKQEGEVGLDRLVVIRQWPTSTWPLAWRTAQRGRAAERGRRGRGGGGEFGCGEGGGARLRLRIKIGRAAVSL